MPTFPVDHGWAPKWSMTAALSRASRGEKKLSASVPSLPPVPRTSATTATMPRVANNAGEMQPHTPLRLYGVIASTTGNRPGARTAPSSEG